jgi:short-subunit dehydrogenase
MLVARSAGPLEEIAAKVGGTAFPTDVGSTDQLEGLIDRIEGKAGPVDILIGNAAVAHPAHVVGGRDEDVVQTTSVNYLGSVLLTRQVVPRMIERGGGHIVYLMGIAAVTPIPGIAAFGAAGAALNSFARSLRVELKGKSIGVTTVVLGPVRTTLFEKLMTYPPYRATVRRYQRLRTIVETDPETVARAVVEAVRTGSRRVALPRRLAPSIALQELPARFGELVAGRLGSK